MYPLCSKNSNRLLDIVDSFLDRHAKHVLEEGSIAERLRHEDIKYTWEQRDWVGEAHDVLYHAVREE